MRMNVRTAGLLIAALLSATPALAQFASPNARSAWKGAPSEADIAVVYPPRARAAKLGGSATIACAVAVTGRLQSCAVVSETPRGHGFGAAALSLADKFAMEPKLVQGRPVAGGVVRIPIVFRLPDQATKA